jgi:hypothetical protein
VFVYRKGYGMSDKKINYPLCVFFGVAIFIMYTNAMGVSIIDYYSRLISKPVPKSVYDLNTSLSEKIFQLTKEKNKFFREKKSLDADVSVLESKLKNQKDAFDKLNSEYREALDKIKVFSNTSSAGKDLIASFAAKDPEFKRIYFLFGYGCLGGTKVYSVRKNEFQPEFGYCLYKERKKPDLLVYYDASTSIAISDEFHLGRVAEGYKSNSNEVVLISDDLRYQSVLKFGSKGDVSQKYIMQPLEMIKKVKNLNIILQDLIEEESSYFIVFENWINNNFSDRHYSFSWDSNVCRDNSDHVCVILRLNRSLDGSDFMINIQATITHIYHYSNMDKVIDTKFNFYRTGDVDEINVDADSYSDFLKLVDKYGAWMTVKLKGQL